MPNVVQTAATPKNVKGLPKTGLPLGMKLRKMGKNDDVEENPQSVWAERQEKLI